MIDDPVIEIEITGPPVPKGRPRVTKNGHAFTPAKTRKWERQAQYLAQQHMKGRKPITGPVEVYVCAEFPIPQSWPKWKIALAESGSLAHTGKPDGDNIAKAAIDACNGIVFRDDSQITDLIIRKRYSDSPSVSIQVTSTNMIPASQKRKGK